MAGGEGHTDALHQLLEPMQKQLDLVRGLVERAAAPADAVFDLLAESASAMKRQAEALEAASAALAETARLVKRQSELFEATVATLRQPTELAKAAAGVKRGPAKRRQSS